jgi:hypothetical protein
MKKLTVWLLATLVAGALVGCVSQKAPAEQAVASAETALGAIRDTAQKYVPDQLQTVEAQLTGMKDSLAKRDYRAVLVAAPNLTSAIGRLKDAAEAKKADAEKALAKAKDEWGPMSAEVPKIVAPIRSRVDTLAKSRHLPKGVTKESLASAESGLNSIRVTWVEAQNAAAMGDFVTAMSKAQELKGNAADIMKSLGMTQADTRAGS